jgi:hypothetical protein
MANKKSSKAAKPAAYDNSWRGNTVTGARIQEIDYSVDRKTRE